MARWLTRAIGTAPVGWLGPELGESERTPRLLAQMGLRYVCDWVNDEEPYPLKVPQGEEGKEIEVPPRSHSRFTAIRGRLVDG